MVTAVRPVSAIASTRFTRLVDKRVSKYISGRAVLAHGERVAVGVSGGADSTALLIILSRTARDLGTRLTAAHFDHQLRGADEAHADRGFVADLCRSLGIEVGFGAGNVAARARKEKESVEEAARKMRYRFLGQEAKRVGSAAVAVGHTQDDRAETVLMHVIRGSGIDGVAAMPARAGWPFGRGPEIARPLLELTRAETERYCRECGIEPRDDPTNAMLVATRNRVRHEVLPLLREFNPRVEEALSRLAAAAAMDAEFIAAAVDVEWERLAEVTAGRVAFDTRSLNVLHRAVAVRLVRRAAGELEPRSSPSAQQLEAVLAAAGKSRPSSVPLPGGVLVVVGRGRLTLEGAHSGTRRGPGADGG